MRMKNVLKWLRHVERMSDERKAEKIYHEKDLSECVGVLYLFIRYKCF